MVMTTTKFDISTRKTTTSYLDGLSSEENIEEDEMTMFHTAQTFHHSTSLPGTRDFSTTIFPNEKFND